MKLATCLTLLSCIALAAAAAIGGPDVIPRDLAPALAFAAIFGVVFAAIATLPLGRTPRSIFETRRAGLA